MSKPISPKQAAYLFFLKHAGFSYDPKIETARQGRSRCARQLAKAERDARALGMHYNWRNDPDGCSGCDCDSPDCDCSQGNDHETLGCVLYSAEGKHLESLWGICNPSWEYRRVVEAELASEALVSL
jgi:hypothetical protein